MKMTGLFANQNAVLITKHQKETVIFPVLQPLKMKLSVLASIDTDQFGSFTGDVPRMGSQLDAARSKAKKALEVTGESIVIASEGSFGPHPELPFIPANIELVLLVDTLHHIEISGWAISTNTNFSCEVVSTIDDAIRFSKTIGFPSHGIVVRPNVSLERHLSFKGKMNEACLMAAVEKCMNASSDGKAIIETDMRAMYNPTRMRVIELATGNLYRNLISRCPVCEWPGFEVTEWVRGLPCEHCFQPTRSILKEIFVCKNCQHRKEMNYPDKKKYGEARYCDFCNP